jgi:hypothetical protein
LRHGSETLHGWRWGCGRHGIAGHLRRSELWGRREVLRLLGREALRSRSALH